MPHCWLRPLDLIPQRLQGHAALGASFLLCMIIGAEQCIGNILSYMLSYFVIAQKTQLSNGTLSWITTVRYFGQAVALPLCGIVEKKVGTWKTATLASTVITVSQIIAWFGARYVSVIFLTLGAMQGIGQGLLLPVVASVPVAWFPARKGLVSGISLCGVNVSAVVLNFICTFYVNPRNVGTTRTPEGWYFTDPALLARLPNVFLVAAAYTGTAQLLALPFFFKPPQDAGYYEELASTEPTEAPTSARSHIKQMLRKPSFAMVWISFAMRSGMFLIVITYFKLYGLTLTNNDHMLGIVAGVAALASMAGKIAAGQLADRYSSIAVLACFSGAASFFLSLYALSPQIGIGNYILCTLALFFLVSGILSVAFAVIANLFGQEHYTINVGLLLSSGAPGSLLMAVISTVALGPLGYVGLFLVVAVLMAIPMVLMIVLDFNANAK